MSTLDPDFDRLVFHSPTLTVGAFRAAPSHPRFSDSGPAQHHLIVFPRTAVILQHDGGAPFVAGPPLATFYNRGQRYRRHAMAPQGDQCDWFALAPALLEGLVDTPDTTDHRGARGPFAFTHGPCDADVYFRQRRFVERCLGGEAPDALAAEETAVALAGMLVERARAAWAVRSRIPRPPEGRRRRDMVEHAKAILGARFRERLSIATLARIVGCSPYHLCHVFRRDTGWSLHRFRDEARLREALTRLGEHRGSLTDLALDLGYSSHSHFTAAFRRAFGVAPSAVHQAATGDDAPHPERSGMRPPFRPAGRVRTPRRAGPHTRDRV